MQCLFLSTGGASLQRCTGRCPIQGSSAISRAPNHTLHVELARSKYNLNESDNLNTYKWSGKPSVYHKIEITWITRELWFKLRGNSYMTSTLVGGSGPWGTSKADKKTEVLREASVTVTIGGRDGSRNLNILRTSSF